MATLRAWLQSIGLNRLVVLALALSLLGSVVYTLAQIAQKTAVNTHPDEIYHVDAFCYFERQAWVPALNSTQVIYQGDGISRVYTGEIVYWVYGRATVLLRAGSKIQVNIAPLPTEKTHQVFLPTVYHLQIDRCFPLLTRAFVQPYRWLNVGLFLVTVLGMMYAAWRQPQLIGLVGLLLALPQLAYMYGYANSDAWGMTWSMGLFAYAVTANRLRTWANALIFGGVLGLVLLSKLPFWLGLPFTLLAVSWQVWHDPVPLPRRILARNLGLVLAVALLLNAPLKLFYPLSQGITTYNAEYQAMVAEQIDPAYVGRPNFGLAARGAPFQTVWANPYWYETSAQSFYGVFGYMEVYAPMWVYGVAALGLALQLLVTLITLVRRWAEIPQLWRLLLVSTPLLCLMLIVFSLYRSWTYELQPQGRYLFAGLPALALLLGGTWPQEARWLRGGRLVLWGLLGLLNVWVIQTLVVNGTYFR